MEFTWIANQRGVGARTGLARTQRRSRAVQAMHSLVEATSESERRLHATAMVRPSVALVRRASRRSLDTASDAMPSGYSTGS